MTKTFADWNIFKIKQKILIYLHFWADCATFFLYFDSSLYFLVAAFSWHGLTVWFQLNARMKILVFPCTGHAYYGKFGKMDSQCHSWCHTINSKVFFSKTSHDILIKLIGSLDLSICDFKYTCKTMTQMHFVSKKFIRN